MRGVQSLYKNIDFRQFLLIMHIFVYIDDNRKRDFWQHDNM